MNEIPIISDGKPKFKDLNFDQPIGGLIVNEDNTLIYPCKAGEYTVFHLKGGSGKDRVSEYILRKGKKYIIEPMVRDSFLSKMDELGYVMEWEKDEDGNNTKKVIIKKEHRGIIKSLTDFIK